MDINVAKYGSALVACEEGIKKEAIGSYAEELIDVDGLIVITSGAVAVGRSFYQEHFNEALPMTKRNLKLFAGLGCTAVFRAFEEAFANRGRLASSYPITHTQLRLGSGFSDVLEHNAQVGVVSIINEADAISQEELMKLATGGDNDGLARHVAVAMGAKKMCLFTGRGGVVDDKGGLIEVIDNDNIKDVRKMLKNRETKIDSIGRGGMGTKVEAGFAAANKGIDVSISAVGNGMDGNNATRFVIR